MAVLGCAEDYQVGFTDRTGQVPTGPALEASSITWGRELDATSEAVVTFPGDDPDCCSAVADVHAWCNDLCIYRDGQMVWQGPVVRSVSSRSQTQVVARDVTGWLSRRVIGSRIDYTTATGAGPADLTVVAEALVRDGFGPDDPNVLPYLTVLPSGVAGEREYNPDTAYVYDELRELARGGIDFTAIGHRIILFGPARPLARLAGLHDEHFAGDLRVIEDGLSATTRAVVVGEGFAAYAERDGACGLLETLVKEQQIKDVASAQAEADALVASGTPTPVILEVPAGAQLTPDAPVGIMDLVPGVVIPVTAVDVCRPVTAAMQLTKVDVTYDDRGGEAVKVTLAAPGSDTLDI